MALPVVSDRVFQMRALLTTSELIPLVPAFLFSNCSGILVLNSNLMCFLSKNVYINDGLSAERRLKI